MMNHLLRTIEATNSENYLENLSKIRAHIHIVAIDSDLFFLAAENKETYKELSKTSVSGMIFSVWVLLFEKSASEVSDTAYIHVAVISQKRLLVW